ncbi:MAG TPA: PEGA domain-containing protein, partial [Gemmatimonadaceae bacterium]|nr:PEGA domain-containing protein [Gemmatimonadaceae bacterium]
TAAAGPVTPAVVAPAPPGLIRARAYPVDAEIFIDGASLGRGVVLDARVPSGRRRLHVRAPGYADFDSTVVIVAGQTTQLPRINLRPTELTP